MARRGKAGTMAKKGLIRNLWRRIACDRMGSAVVLMMLALLVFLSYIGVYAKVTKNGYHRAKLVSQLQEARVENVRLRADIQMLSSPERLAKVASESGMQACNQFDYLENAAPVVVANAGEE